MDLSVAITEFAHRIAILAVVVPIAGLAIVAAVGLLSRGRGF